MEEISGVAFIFNQKFFQDLKEETGETVTFLQTRPLSLPRGEAAFPSSKEWDTHVLDIYFLSKHLLNVHYVLRLSIVGYKAKADVVPLQGGTHVTLLCRDQCEIQGVSKWGVSHLGVVPEEAQVLLCSVPGAFPPRAPGMPRELDTQPGP